MTKFSFPIRLKVLVTLMLTLMLVVGVITVTMANLFQQDKIAYVRDFNVAVTSNMQADVETTLGSHLSAARVLAEFLFADYIDTAAKQRLAKPIFVAYPDLLALVTIGAGREPLSLYNKDALRKADIEPDELLELSSLTLLRDEGAVTVRSALNDSDRGAVSLTFGHRLPDEEKDVPVIAVVSSEELSRVLLDGRPFESALLDPDQKPLLAVGDTQDAVYWSRQALASWEGAGTSGAFEYSADGQDYIAAIAKTQIGNLTIITRISASAAYLTARQLLDDLFFVGLVIVLLASILGVVLSRRITRPLERLSKAVRNIGKGDFDVNVAIESSDEIGELSTSFNDMAGELKEREASLESAQQALVQSEKMAAVGTLSAGLAHEVKNPLSAVLGYAQLSKRKLSQPDALKGYLDTIEQETRRCNEIISNLMQFSRQETGERSQISINDVVRKAIGIVDHQLSLEDIRIGSEFAEDIPDIMGNANQLQQVLMNLMINAQHAIGEGGGTVDIATFVWKESVIITVSDTGPGIDADIAAKIFEPFFTTKPAGHGTGLGLSVSYGIIKDHGGEISVQRADSGGAKIVVKLPLETEPTVTLEQAS